MPTYFVLVLLGLLLQCSVSKPQLHVMRPSLNVLRQPSPLSFSVNSSTGALSVMVAGRRALVTSTFSSFSQQSAFGGTGATAGGWNGTVQISRVSSSAMKIHGTGAIFSVDRLITAKAGRLLVNDTIIVHASEGTVAVQQVHTASFVDHDVEILSVAGPGNEYRSQCESSEVGMYVFPSPEMMRRIRKYVHF